MGGYPGEVSPSQSFQSGAFWEYKLILGLGRSVNGQFVLARKGVSDSVQELKEGIDGVIG